MKQTQTKQFAYTDIDLDFCSGSTQKFPLVFKKILTLGYNVQTVINVVVAGNQVTFTYGGAHGYVADRVLKVDSGALALINDGEFWIDSVTTNTVTFTVDDAPSSVANGFTTRVAPLGWSLEYEASNIHLYKFKHIDNTDLYARFCFTQTYTHRNRVAVCIGKSFDIATGVINDPLSLESTRNLTDPIASAPCMQFSVYGGSNANTHSTYTSEQGASVFGSLGTIVGGKNHLAFVGFAGSVYALNFYINGIFAVNSLNYDALDYPCLIGSLDTTALTSNGSLQATVGVFYSSIGNIRSVIAKITNSTNYTPQAAGVNAYQSFLGSNIDAFNTTTCEPALLREHGTGQCIGEVLGLFAANYSSSNTPSINISTLPQKTKDTDLTFDVYTNYWGTSASNGVFYAVPVREIL